MAKRPGRMWIYSPKRQKVPDYLKVEIQKKADQLVETTLKPEHIKTPPEDYEFNYIVDIFTQWHSGFFYFCAKYHSPGPRAISPYFETKFARLKYIGNNRFNLAYMRHTGQWWEIYDNISPDECLSAIRDEPHFLP